MKCHHFLRCALVTVFLTGSAVAANEVTPPSSSDSLSYFSNKKKQKILKPRVELNHRYSNDRAITMSEFWVPLAEGAQNDSVLFGDLRLMGDNNDNKEFNVGLGYRKSINMGMDNQVIVGGMVWYDRRHTARGSKFNQITAGGEWFTDTYDVRSNLYIPLNDSKTHTQTNPDQTGLGFAGNQIFVNTDQLIVEEALPGVDVEIGTRIKALDKITDATRVYAGAYHFEGNRVEDVTGIRARIASDITQDIQIGARYQYDDVRDSQTYLDATIRFPFKAKKSFKRDGVISRLDESPERDIDIVSNELVIDDGINEVILNAATGITQNVIHVDNTAGGGGDGSFENPFNTLAAAETAAVSHDMIYVHRGDGTTTGQNAGITIDDTGQILAGSGVNLLFSSGKFTTSNNQATSNGIVVQTATSAPVITNSTGNGIDVTADDVLITGITVDGANENGIFAFNADRVLIDSIEATNNGSNFFQIHSGIRIDANGKNLETISVKNSTVDNNINRGIWAQAINGTEVEDITVQNNISKNHSVHGIILQSSNIGSHIDNVNFLNNTAHSNNTGILALASDSGHIETVSIMDNLSFNGLGEGIRTNANNSGYMNNVFLKRNRSYNNNRHGFEVRIFDNGTVNHAVLENNISQNNTLNGFLTHSDGAGSSLNSLDFSSNTSISNDDHNYRIFISNSGNITNANIINNISEASGGAGIRFDVNNANASNITINNNKIFNSDFSGISAFINGTSTVDGYNIVNNNFSNNTDSGAVLSVRNDSQLDNASYNNNLANANGSNGFAVTQSNDAMINGLSFNNNIVTNNGTYGVNIKDNSVTQNAIIDLGGGVLGATGRNSIFNSGLEDITVDLDGNELKAENNYWGNATGLAPANLELLDGSTIDSTPFLTADPN